ncbi:hypothetical protein V8J82_19600 [Gymnodinialimonas sp. 2305UL16-5]|uniref:hypothetical protein n=1 Tax=Gymnodinialimonas mytili TaxID=3126503 RepID=UPI0030A907AB
MTALKDYRRLEALGLWRERPEDQRREVIVSLGEATLVMSSAAGDALGHWSLPAVERLNPGQEPALYAPAADSDEELEVGEPEMIAAIERIRTAIAKSQPRPGRLRLALSIGFGLGVLAVAIFWLPEAMIQQTVSLLPQAKRAEIGRQMLSEITQIAGRPCGAPTGREALMQLAARTFGTDAPPRVVVVPATIPDTMTLPGNIIVASADLAEDYETPEVFAGYLLAERIRGAGADPIETFLREAGLAVTLRLLTTGEVRNDAIHGHAARLLSREGVPVSDTALIDSFAAARISSEPYAFARDVSGETVLGLIEANPMRGSAATPVLSDADWVSLQEICAS